MPFSPDDKINKDVLTRLSEKNITEGVSGFPVFGSIGEAFPLTSGKRKELAETVMASVAAAYRAGNNAEAPGIQQV